MNQNQEKTTIAQLIDYVFNRDTGIDATGLTQSGTAFLISKLLGELNVPIFLVTSSVKEAETLEEDIRFFAPAAGSDQHALQSLGC